MVNHGNKLCDEVIVYHYYYKIAYQFSILRRVNQSSISSARRLTSELTLLLIAKNVKKVKAVLNKKCLKSCTRQWLVKQFLLAHGQKGVKQSCLLSPCIFVYSCCGDLGQDCQKQQEHKISQHADDNNLIVDGSEKSLTSAIQNLDDFSKIFSLTLNDSRTEALWIGSNAGHEQIIVSGKRFK